MISIDFLAKRHVAGLEFIDFQSEEFSTKLTSVLAEHIRVEGKHGELSNSCQESLLKVIAEYTGFSNISLNFMSSGNLYVNTGYFSPNHVLNNPMADILLQPTQSTLYRWFEEHEEKVFKGGIDYKTGRVTGSFCTLPIEMGINTNISAYLTADLVKKWGSSLPEALAGCIVHELGHVFSGCMMLATTMRDNLVGRTALECYRKAPRSEERVVVLKDTATLLDMKPGKVEELKAFADNGDDEQFMLFFTKLLNQRNTQRALSVGVSRMTSEVVADMYSIRMGCSRGIVAGIGSLVDRGVIRTNFETLVMGCVGAFRMGLGAMFLVGYGIVSTGVVGFLVGSVALGFFLGAVYGYFSPEYAGDYNGNHRRMEDAVRQLIAKLKTMKDMPGKERNDLVDYLVKLLDGLHKLKPWYENTVIYRSMGWVFSPTDFSRKEIEHHTQALNNHELSVLAAQVTSLT